MSNNRVTSERTFGSRTPAAIKPKVGCATSQPPMRERTAGVSVEAARVGAEEIMNLDLACPELMPA
jgi:hypothetical protein